MKKWMMTAALAVAGLAVADARAQSPYNPSQTYVPVQATVVSPAPVTGPTYVQGNAACPPGQPCPQPMAAAPAPAPQMGAYGTGGGHKFKTGAHWTKGGLFSIFGGSYVSQMPTLPVYMAA